MRAIVLYGMRKGQVVENVKPVGISKVDRQPLYEVKCQDGTIRSYKADEIDLIKE